ncbi:hypothetical protein [Sulfuricurvum sp.]|uniref:hypothetical protein n=1 Tax=Sulfuricurvum sp. TaxID=2025608 RepID=UPI002E350E66|nr:hypothetical protein [Sulfuricurvum sp.]HEX5329452.1 hypothetical protein [Sulfuricurvum sp.]
MNFEQFEKYIKNHKIWSIPLIISFIVTSIYNLPEAYEKIASFFSKEYDLKIELLQMDKDNIHVYTATNRQDPYISSIGSWYKFRLTNNGNKPLSLNSILFDGTQNIPAFQNYYIDKDVIYLSKLTTLPKSININESIDLYLFIPFQINRELGEKLFSLLYKADNKLDTGIELYLFGKEPEIQKQTLPMYINGKFVRTISVELNVTNWNEYPFPRTLYSQMDRINDIMPFDYNLKDGFIYMEKNEILSNIVEPTDTEINMNSIYKNTKHDVQIVFEMNNNMKFKIDLCVDSTGLVLMNKI